MLCGEGGNESGCACSGFGGVGGSVSGGREKSHHKNYEHHYHYQHHIYNCPHKFKSISPNHTITGTIAVNSPPPILSDYGYCCEGGVRLLVVVVTY